jgi:hypothetical protein
MMVSALTATRAATAWSLNRIDAGKPVSDPNLAVRVFFVLNLYV